MAKHLDGKKLRGKHTTLHDSSVSVVNRIINSDLVNGIMAGFIDARARSRMPRLKIKKVPAGLELQVLGNVGKQTLYVYTSDPDAVSLLLEDFVIST